MVPFCFVNLADVEMPQGVRTLEVQEARASQVNDREQRTPAQSRKLEGG
jgi:hypothetical protein